MSIRCGLKTSTLQNRSGIARANNDCAYYKGQLGKNQSKFGAYDSCHAPTDREALEQLLAVVRLVSSDSMYNYTMSLLFQFEQLIYISCFLFLWTTLSLLLNA